VFESTGQPAAVVLQTAASNPKAYTSAFQGIQPGTQKPVPVNVPAAPKPTTQNSLMTLPDRSASTNSTPNNPQNGIGQGYSQYGKGYGQGQNQQWDRNQGGRGYNGNQQWNSGN
jgi:hypothetical protein